MPRVGRGLACGHIGSVLSDQLLSARSDVASLQRLIDERTGCSADDAVLACRCIRYRPDCGALGGQAVATIAAWRQQSP